MLGVKDYKEDCSNNNTDDDRGMNISSSDSQGGDNSNKQKSGSDKQVGDEQNGDDKQVLLNSRRHDSLSHHARIRARTRSRDRSCTPSRCCKMVLYPLMFLVFIFACFSPNTYGCYHSADVLPRLDDSDDDSYDGEEEPTDEETSKKRKQRCRQAWMRLFKRVFWSVVPIGLGLAQIFLLGLQLG